MLDTRHVKIQHIVPANSGAGSNADSGRKEIVGDSSVSSPGRSQYFRKPEFIRLTRIFRVNPHISISPFL